jgi:hypothetical protein
MAKDELEVYEESLKCFVSKEGYKEKDLGVGLKVSRVARTGQISVCSPVLDMISLKTFVKHGIRRTSMNETFAYWFPLYLEKDSKSKLLHLGRNALSFICTGTTKKFAPDQISKVFVRAISTTFVEMVSGRRWPSVLMLRNIVYFHTLLLVFVQEYPEVRADFESKIKNFIESEDARHKTNFPNIIDLLVYLMATEKYSFADVIHAYTEEQLDRQVFWLLRKFPELESVKDKVVLDNDKKIIHFRSQVIGYHLVCFYKLYLDEARKSAKDWGAFLTMMEANHSKLPDKLETKIQNELKATLAGVEDYQDYWQYVGMKKTDEETIERLKQAMVNSRKKKYHGDVDTILSIKPVMEQITELQSKKTDVLDFWEEKTGKLVGVADGVWKDRVLERWNWTKRFTQFNKTEEISPAWLAEFTDGKMNYQYCLEIEDFADPVELYNQKCAMPEFSRHQPQIQDKYPSDQFKWVDLYVKLDVEETMRCLNVRPEFKRLYEKCDKLASYLKSISLYIIETTAIKSGYYYLTAVLGKLTHAKHMNFKPCLTTIVSIKASKAMKKGFTNLLTNNSSISSLTFRDMTWQSSLEVEESMYKVFECVPDLKSLSLYNAQLLFLRQGKILSHLLTTHVHIEELIIDNSLMSSEVGKELADGLMRCKKLRSLLIPNNKHALSTSVAGIVYNLAFSPKLEYLDIKGAMSSPPATLVENLGKLLSISGSLEWLGLEDTGIYGMLKWQTFFKSLGENTILKGINLNNNYAPAGDAAVHSGLGKAIGFNARAKGALEELHLSTGIKSFDKFVSSMRISNKCYEEEYGDRVKASKMGGEDLTFHFNCRLKMLDLSDGVINAASFNVDAWKRKQCKNLPDFRYLLSNCPSLTHLNLRNSNASSNFFDLFNLLLEEKNVCNLEFLDISRSTLTKSMIPTVGSIISRLPQLRVLNMSKCKLGVAGGHLLKKPFSECSKLEYLNLFNNLLDVDGLRSISQILATNKSLKYIDFGFNRLRDEGLKNVSKFLAQNSESSLEALGLRYNFLNENSVLEFLSNLKNSKIHTLFIKKNNIPQGSLTTIKEKALAVNPRFYCDMFDKLDITREDLLNRTIWVSDIPKIDKTSTANWFEKMRECGKIMNIRHRKGTNYPNKDKDIAFGFIEFASEESVMKALMMGKKKRKIGNSKITMYRAGSATYFYSKSCAAKDSKTNYAANNSKGAVRRKIQKGGFRR